MNFHCKHTIASKNVTSILFLLYVCKCLHVSLYSMCMPGIWKAQKRESDSLELEFLAFVSHHVDPWDETQVL